MHVKLFSEFSLNNEQAKLNDVSSKVSCYKILFPVQKMSIEFSIILNHNSVYQKGQLINYNKRVQRQFSLKMLLSRKIDT